MHRCSSRSETRLRRPPRERLSALVREAVAGALAKSQPRSRVAPGYLSAAEMAQFLGVGGRTLARWIAEAGLPCYRVVGRLLFRQGEVERWVRKLGRRNGRGRKDLAVQAEPAYNAGGREHGAGAAGEESEP